MITTTDTSALYPFILQVTLRASCDLKAGDHLSIMYTHSLWATWARRDHLAGIKHFWCKCQRCE